MIGVHKQSLLIQLETYKVIKGTPTPYIRLYNLLYLIKHETRTKSVQKKSFSIAKQ